MAGTTDDTGTTLPINKPTSEQGNMTDISRSLAAIESLDETIAMELRKAKKNGDKTTTLVLESLLPSLNFAQSSLRKALDAHAQPKDQKPPIHGLPTELLVMIFEKVRGRASIQDIQNVRLVCKEFCNAGSHLLIRGLEVTLTTSSLDRLNKVSRHPLISKGVRSLWISAALYDSRRAINLRQFTEEFVEIMRSHQDDDIHDMQVAVAELTSAERPASPNGSPSPFPWYLSETAENMQKRDEILIACSKYLRFELLQPDENDIMAPFFQLYREYSEICKDQKWLLEYGSFVRRVAEAVARMPQVTGLSIFDMDDEDHPVLSEIPSPFFSHFREPLLETCHWDPELVSLLPKNPVMLLYQLPIAFSRAGKPLIQLRINLWSYFEHSLRLTKDEIKDLVSAAENLEHLTLEFRLPSRPFHTREHWKGLSELARSLFKSTKLRSVSLLCGSWVGSRRSYDYSFEPLLALLPWASLNNIHLRTIAIHYTELKEHLEKLAPGTSIDLQGVYLLSGKWADLLDVVRGKADCHSEVSYPRGKEDEELGQAFTDTMKNWAPCNNNPASKYIRGETSENPLRLPPAQDNAEEDDAD